MGILDACERVREALGTHFSESIYHRALEVELRDKGVSYESEAVIPVVYGCKNVGSVRADLIVQNEVVVELKAVAKISSAHIGQVRNYMRLRGVQTGVVVNMSAEQSLEWSIVTE